MRIDQTDLPTKPFLSFAYTQDTNRDGSQRLAQRLAYKGHTSMRAARRSSEALRRSLVDEHPEALLSWGYAEIEESARRIGMVL